MKRTKDRKVRTCMMKMGGGVDDELDEIAVKKRTATSITPKGC